MSKCISAGCRVNLYIFVFSRHCRKENCRLWDRAKRHNSIGQRKITTRHGCTYKVLVYVYSYLQSFGRFVFCTANCTNMRISQHFVLRSTSFGSRLIVNIRSQYWMVRHLDGLHIHSHTTRGWMIIFRKFSSPCIIRFKFFEISLLAMQRFDGRSQMFSFQCFNSGRSVTNYFNFLETQFPHQYLVLFLQISYHHQKRISLSFQNGVMHFDWYPIHRSIWILMFLLHLKVVTEFIFWCSLTE